VQQTSYAAPNLPANQTLYARMWTEVGGVWRNADITFSGAGRATLTFPADECIQSPLLCAVQGQPAGVVTANVDEPPAAGQTALDGGQAKPYRVRQVLRLIERYNLKLEDCSIGTVARRKARQERP
jgi:hypothetical protein